MPVEIGRAAPGSVDGFFKSNEREALKSLYDFSVIWHEQSHDFSATEGGEPAPRLAGLSYDYLAGTMRDFADGKRTNNGDMPGFMKALSEADRDAMAKYLAGL